jgi:hypothetical protein
VAELEPPLAVPRNRLLLLRARLVEPSLCLPQPALASLPAGEVGGELIASGLAVALVLGGVDLGRLGEHLGRDLLVGADRRVRGRGGELRAVDGDHARPDQPRLGAEAEHLAEEASQGLLVAGAKAGDRRVVGGLVGGDHAEGDVLAAAALDPARASLTDAVGVREQRQHHPRVVGGGAVAVGAVGGIEGPEVEPVDRLDHEPGEMVLVKPVAEVGGQQQ